MTGTIVVTNDPAVTVAQEVPAITAVVPVVAVPPNTKQGISISNQLPLAVDFNTVTSAGFYYTQDSSSINAPVTLQFWYLYVDVDGANPTTFCVQTAVNLNAALATYQRTLVSGVWGAWQQIVMLTSSGILPVVDGSQLINLPPQVDRSYLAGLTLSTAGSSATFSVAAGQASDTTNVNPMQLAASINKTTGAWAVGTGNGALDTGAIANSTWYHAYLIKRTDTNVVDVLVSLSASAPTLPASYTLFRRIGAMKTNGSAQWTKFVQLGNEFLWDTTVNDVNVATLTNSGSTLFTLTVPTNVQVNALFRGVVSNASAGTGVLITSPDESSQAAGSVAGNFTADNPIAGTAAGTSFTLNVRTNTSAQIRAIASAASTTLQIATYGWIDSRGRDL